MAKRAQQGSGEERVTAKSTPMMNLTSRMPSVVSSSTSSNPMRTSYEYQDPGKSVASDDRSVVDNYRTMFESRISAGGVEKLPLPQNLRISSWSYDMAGHAKKCVERYRELANRTTQQLYKVSTPCIDDHHVKEEEMKSVGELSHVCSQIVLKCLCWQELIGRPDIPWSVNKLARSITKWTKACDKRLNRLISYIHYTCEYKQYCYVGNTSKQCRLGLF